MQEQDPQRRAARYRLDRLVEQDPPSDASTGTSTGTTPTAAEPDAVPDAVPRAVPAAPQPRNMASRGAFADELVRQAMARGEFDDLPLTGKPIPGLTGRHDPNWWLKAFIEREQVTGVLPEALQLRKDDAGLDDVLDRETFEERVREILAEFNARVVEARRQLLGGPPVVTPLRDVEAEVTRWQERRRARQEQAAATEERSRASARSAGGSTWWRRRPAGPDHHARTG